MLRAEVGMRVRCANKASAGCSGGLDLVTNRKGVFQAPGARRSQHRLSSFLLTKYGSHGCNDVGCANTNGHRPTNTRSCFSPQEAVLNEVEQRFDCVQAQTHMYPSLVGGIHSYPEPNSSPPSPKSYPFHR